MPDRGLLTVREVAAEMRVSTMTVYRLIKAGELPAIRVGKHFRIKGGDLHAYLDSRIVGGPGFGRPPASVPEAAPDEPVRTEPGGARMRGTARPEGGNEFGGGSWPGG
jgi:excisionase family DNA binding protein